MFSIYFKPGAQSKLVRFMLFCYSFKNIVLAIFYSVRITVSGKHHMVVTH